MERITASTFFSPNHHDASRHAAAHVEGQKSLDALNLAIAGGPSELAIRFDHLANARRPDGVAVAHETAAWIDRHISDCGLRIADFQSRTHGRQSRCAALQQIRPCTGLSETQD